MTTKLVRIKHLDLVFSFKNIVLRWLQYILRELIFESIYTLTQKNNSLVNHYRLQSSEDSSVAAVRFALLLLLKMDTRQTPRWWQERRGKQSQQCKHCQRQLRTNYNQQWESQLSDFFLMTFCFPSTPFQLVLKDILLFFLFLSSTAPTFGLHSVLGISQYVYIHEGFVFLLNANKAFDSAFTERQWNEHNWSKIISHWRFCLTWIMKLDS